MREEEVAANSRNI